MVKMLNAFTLEADDVGFAVEEILAQLDLENNLLAHTGGILTCHADYVETGVAAAVCRALPFDVVGCTTLGCGIPGQSDSLMLSLSVLTSDDVRVVSGFAPHATREKLAPAMNASYAAATRDVAQTPALGLVFGSFLADLGGEEFMQALTAAMPGVPVFGTLACSHNFDATLSQVIYNGKCQNSGVAFLLLCGDVQPRFSITSISPAKVQKHRGIITDSEGSLLRAVNHMPTRKYLESIGIVQPGDTEVMPNIPFLVDYNDGTETPVARAAYALTPEGYGLFGGSMPKGSTLAVGSLAREDVQQTARDTVAALAAKQPDCMLVVSCLTRSLVLGASISAEMDAVEGAAGRVPYQMLYSGGEICPVYDAQGQPVNRFHNFSLVACAL